MGDRERFLSEHVDITRRYFLALGTVGMVALRSSPLWAQGRGRDDSEQQLDEELSKLEYLTREEDFINYGRGTPPPHELPPEKLREVGLVPETWQLEVLPDPESDAKVEQPLSKDLGTALNWDGFMKLAEKHATRVMSVMSCTNGSRPCGMGL